MSADREPKWKHRDCPCGCGEMADECMQPIGRRDPFAGAFRVTCWRSECRNGCYYPTVCMEVPR